MTVITEPDTSLPRRAPRIVAPQYVFVFRPDSSDQDEVIHSIINGLDPALVDPKYYPSLFPSLLTKQEHLRREGHVAGTRAAGEALYYFQQRLAQERQRREFERQQALLLEEGAAREEERSLAPLPELPAEIVELALAGRYKEIDPMLHGRVVERLQVIEEAAILRKDYHAASQSNAAIRGIMSMTCDTKYEEIATGIETDCQDKVDTARREMAHRDEFWQNEIDKKRAQNAAELKAMVDQCRDELEVFDEQYEKSPSRPFQRYSATYWNLREQQRHLSITKRFMEAKAKSEEAARQGEQEAVEFQAKYMADPEVKRAEMMWRMTERLDVEQSKANEELFLLERESKRDLEQANLALRRLEKQCQEAEVLTSMIPGTSRTSPRVSARSIRSAQSCRVRRIGPPAEERLPQEIFRQRRAINSIVYSTCRT
jgi:hypothetical protein